MQAPDDAEALLPPSGDPDAVPWADDEAAKKKQRRVVSCATRWSPEEEQALLSTVSAISTEGPPRAPGKLSRREWDVVAERMGDARSSSSISQHYLIMIGLRRRHNIKKFDFTPEVIAHLRTLPGGDEFIAAGPTYDAAGPDPADSDDIMPVAEPATPGMTADAIAVAIGPASKPAQEADHVMPQQVGLPEGWTAVRHEAPAGPYFVYHGPAGEKVRSKVKAWRVFRGIDDAAATAATSATATAIANALHLDAGFAFPDGHASSLSAAHSPPFAEMVPNADVDDEVMMVDAVIAGDVTEEEDDDEGEGDGSRPIAEVVSAELVPAPVTRVPIVAPISASASASTPVVAEAGASQLPRASAVPLGSASLPPESLPSAPAAPFPFQPPPEHAVYVQPVGQFSGNTGLAAMPHQQHPPLYQQDVGPDEAGLGKRNRKRGGCSKRWTLEEERQLLETLADVRASKGSNAPLSVVFDEIAQRMGSSRTGDGLLQHWQIMEGRRKSSKTSTASREAAPPQSGADAVGAAEAQQSQMSESGAEQPAQPPQEGALPAEPTTSAASPPDSGPVEHKIAIGGGGCTIVIEDLDD